MAKKGKKAKGFAGKFFGKKKDKKGMSSDPNDEAKAKIAQ